MDNFARIEAAKQWNATACGEVEGQKASAEYFQRVEADRYRQQSWQRGYFRFDRFAEKKILEIGIGQGTDLMQFARGGAICHGVDITDNHLELTQANFDIQEKAVKLYKSDATQLPFPDDSFDCIYSFGVIHHIPEAEQVAAEIFRVLKPGGYVMTAFYYKWSAFHVARLLKGLIRGSLFRLGYSGFLSTIETGADGKKIKPYVELYTKRDVRRLFAQFELEDVSIHQFTLNQILPNWLCRCFRHAHLPLAGLVGWYVACRAQKPALVE